MVTDNISRVLIHAWAPSTRETYGSGLLAFHIFCDHHHIPEVQRAPCSSTLLAAFISSLAGAYSGKTLANYVFGVRAWHLIHGLRWCINQAELDSLLKAAVSLTPSSSLRKPRQPFTVSYIISLRESLNLLHPFDAAVYACLATTFYATARVGEFTVPTLTSFSPSLHVKPSDISRDTDRNGFEVYNFHLPRTKSASSGMHLRLLTNVISCYLQERVSFGLDRTIFLIPFAH